MNLTEDADSSDPTLVLSRFMQGSVLRGVLAIADVVRSDRGDVSLLSLESYDDGFALFYRVTRTAAPSPDPVNLFLGGMHPNLLFGRAEDDLGNEYVGGLGGGSGGGNQWRGEAMFTPAIAGGATRVLIRIEEIQWMSFLPGRRSHAEAGPWTFDVSLAAMKSVTN
jgi:hypothetical protein